MLAKVANIEVSNKAFPWLTARRMSIKAAGVIAMRVNFVGELGHVAHHPIETQNVISRRVDGGGRAVWRQAVRQPRHGAVRAGSWTSSFWVCNLLIEDAVLESDLEKICRFRQRSVPWGCDALRRWRDKRVYEQAADAADPGLTDADARGSEW